MRTLPCYLYLILVFSVFTTSSRAQDDDLLFFGEEPIVITATKQEQKLSEAPATMTVITQQDIIERGYQQLEDVLRDLPGFDFVHVNGTWPTQWIQRGLYGDENKRTLLMIDGIVENNILEGSVLGGPQYSLHNIERIEIIWGPASALYGANAFGGIVNLITRRGVDVKGLEYEKGYGSYQTSFDKFIIGVSKNEVEISLSGSLYNTDGPVFKERHPDYTNSYVDDAFSIVGRLSYKNFTFGYHRYDRPMGDGQFSNSPAVFGYGLVPYGFENSEGFNGGEGQTDINGEHGTLWHSITETAFLNASYDLHSNWTTSFSSTYRRTGIADDSYGYDYSPPTFDTEGNILEGGEFIKYLYTHDSNLFRFEAQSDYVYQDKHTLIAGANYERSEVERGYRGMASANSLLDRDEGVFNIYENIAAFGQISSRITDEIQITCGVRFDDNSVYGQTTNPRIGLIWKLAENLSFKGMFGTAYRAPNSFEMFTETNVRIANPDLKPEREKSSEIGLSFQPHNRLKLEGNFFYNDFEDIIVSNVSIGDVDNDGVDNFQNRNQGTAEVLGAEMKISYYINTDLNIFVNASFIDAQQDDGINEYDVPNVADIKGNFGVNWLIADFLNVNWIGNIVGERSTAPTNPREKVNGYWINHLTLTTRDLFYEDVAVGLSVYNIFNADYVDPGIRGASGGYYGTRHVQPGRNGLVKLMIVF